MEKSGRLQVNIPDDLSREDSLGWLVAVLNAGMLKGMDERLRPLGLGLAVWPTLFVLWEEDGLTQTELASRCRTAHYTTTRVLNSLEESGLIERRAHPHSRRAHCVFLTPMGQSLKKRGVRAATACNRAFLSQLSPEEQSNLLQYLRRMVVL